jgi:hypothetical protein
MNQILEKSIRMKTSIMPVHNSSIDSDSELEMTRGMVRLGVHTSTSGEHV